MKVLYITGACLIKNTSANLSHNAFLKGFIDNNCEVDIIMASDSWGEEDKALPRYSEAAYYEFNSVSFADKLRNNTKNAMLASNNYADSTPDSENRLSFKQKLRLIVKKVFYAIFPQDKIHPLNQKWLKTAAKFKSEDEFDIVISNSSPAASHKLVYLLKQKNRIKYKRWIQIWEDPWFYDLYGGHSEAEREEEHFLLKEASEIYYVSPLTLMYQKKHFADCADKMKCVPLPFLDYSEPVEERPIQDSFGYFGDYYSVTRNLQPFYNALLKSGYKGFIYGDSDLNLQKTDNIEVSGRVTLDILSEIQNKTEILVHLCNLKGGQIPGKIYHYSATKKPILFILDGTEDEKKALFDFFGAFDRYYFCDNNEDDILKVMKRIVDEHKTFEPVTVFSPKEVVRRIIFDEKTVIY